MLCVVGEALIDLIATGAPGAGVREYRAYPGGSPYNVALGLARLGRHTALQARLSRDAFGRQLRDHAEAQGVDLSLAVSANQPSTLAVVGVDDQRNAVYDFYVAGTADWGWSAPELALTPQDAEWLHFGSLASWLAPGAQLVSEHVRLRRASGIPISFDPNVRPLLMPDRAAALRRIEANIASADIVKASSEDVEWLYPGRDLEAVMRDWLALGPQLVVVTDGGRGTHGLGRSSPMVFQPPAEVVVVDTVGAGDAFMSGLIDAAVSTPATSWGITEQVETLLRTASVVAALTVSRAGADPPTREEVAAAGVRFRH